MAVTSAEATGSAPKGRRRREHETTLDNHIDRPSTVAPGDAPFDTTDPLERATSVEPDKAAAARAGFGTVNAVVPLPEPEREEEPRGEDRTEKYKVVGPNGKLVSVTRNIETGETTID